MSTDPLDDNRAGRDLAWSTQGEDRRRPDDFRVVASTLAGVPGRRKNNMSRTPTGVINASEAYSKTEVMNRLGISQRFWDSMLNDGLPFANIGHGRWVTGQSLIDYMNQHAETKAQRPDDSAVQMS